MKLLRLLKHFDKVVTEGEGPPCDLWDRVCHSNFGGEALDGSAGRSGPREER